MRVENLCPVDHDPLHLEDVDAVPSAVPSAPPAEPGEEAAEAKEEKRQQPWGGWVLGFKDVGVKIQQTMEKNMGK